MLKSKNLKCKWYGLIALMVTLMGCQIRGQHSAPVTALQAAAQHEYLVQPGDHLYAIAWAYGLDAQALAQYNHLQSPYYLKQGDVLRLPKTQLIEYRGSVPLIHLGMHSSRLNGREPADSTFPKTSSSHKIQHKMRRSLTHFKVRWQRPVQGVMIPAAPPRHGVWIRSRKGAFVHAIAPGVIVYSGTGLKGYGHLIMIQHKHNMVSAYGYNTHIRVKVGQRIRQNQVISSVGLAERQIPMLYFEVRHQGVALSLNEFFSKS